MAYDKLFESMRKQGKLRDTQIDLAISKGLISEEKGQQLKNLNPED